MFPFEVPALQASQETIPWSELSWKQVAVNLKEFLNKITVQLISQGQEDYGFAIRPYMQGGSLDPLNQLIFLRYDEKKKYFVVNDLHENTYEEPSDWIPGGEPYTMAFHVSPYDQLNRHMQFHFVFFLNANGVFQKLYMRPTWITVTGSHQQHKIYADDFPNAEKKGNFIWSHWNRNVTAIPNRVLTTLKLATQNRDGPVLIPRLLYSMTLCQSEFAEDPDFHDLIITAIRPAFNHQLWLDNLHVMEGNHMSELPYVSRCAQRMLEYFYHQALLVQRGIDSTSNCDLL
jgi:hypothetical protein